MPLYARAWTSKAGASQRKRSVTAAILLGKE
jgi:hypothetical protein